MEKIQNRADYINEFRDFCEIVRLSEDFMKELKEHEYFKDTLRYINEYENEETKKVFILLELTQKRKSCDTVIELLRKSGQTEAANKLQIYNTSSGTLLFSDLSYKAEILVNRAVYPMSESMTLPYSMIRYPRGKFIIINNIPELAKQTKRFKHVFKELYFIPESHENKTIMEIKTILEKFSEDPNIANYDAFAFMIVTHGEDEKVLGFNAFRGVNDPERDVNDHMKMSEIVNFVYEICRRMESEYSKPKIVIFNCCRIHEQKPTVDFTLKRSGMEGTKFLDENNKAKIQTRILNEKVEVKFNFADIKWENNNKDTFIIYSCSEGEKSYYYAIHGITAFGQSFSHAIARYACEQSLSQIMTHTCSLMEQLENRPLYSKPESRALLGTHEIYFNVGHAENRIESSNHWLYGFAQRLFKKTFGRFCNHRNQNFVFFSTILFFIMYVSKK